jgi:hypothetical protein
MQEAWPITLIHLGTAVPPYLKDCVHQLRLWSPASNSRIYIVLEPVHRDAAGQPPLFWASLVEQYAVELRYTDELEPTPEHIAFRNSYKGDTAFRKGYWRHVKERFFFMEELMIKEGLPDMIAMEYDVLLYSPIELVAGYIRQYAKGRLAFVMDTPLRGHPGFMFIGSQVVMHALNDCFMQLATKPFEDMHTLAIFKANYPDLVATLPVMTPQRHGLVSGPRRSTSGHECADHSFLSDGFEETSCLFDSLSIGQFLGGVDPRNSGGQHTVGYINETALYSPLEMEIAWAKVGPSLWIPMLDGAPLVTIHMHSKALAPFLSDRETVPMASADDVAAVWQTLEPNEAT